MTTNYENEFLYRHVPPVPPKIQFVLKLRQSAASTYQKIYIYFRRNMILQCENIYFAAFTKLN